MKRVNVLSAVGGLIAVLALSATAAFGEAPEKGSAKVTGSQWQ